MKTAVIVRGTEHLNIPDEDINNIRNGRYNVNNLIPASRLDRTNFGFSGAE